MENCTTNIRIEYARNNSGPEGNEYINRITPSITFLQSIAICQTDNYRYFIANHNDDNCAVI